MDTPFLVAIVDLSYLKDEKNWCQKAQHLLQAARENPWLKVQLRTKTAISKSTLSKLHNEYATMESCHWNLSQPLPGTVAHRHLPESKAVNQSEGNFSVSVHTMEMALRMRTNGARWIQMAPIFKPTHKPGHPFGLSNLNLMCRKSQIPVVAAGGITPENVDQVLKSGVVGVASIGYIMQAQRPFLAAQEMYSAFNSSPNARFEQP